MLARAFDNDAHATRVIEFDTYAIVEIQVFQRHRVRVGRNKGRVICYSTDTSVVRGVETSTRSLSPASFEYRRDSSKSDSAKYRIRLGNTGTTVAL